MRLLFDLETNGLLDRQDLKLLCAAVVDIDSDQEWTFRLGSHPDSGEDIQRLVSLLESATLLVGHNIAGFDIPVLERLVRGINLTWEIYDTRLASRQIFFDTILKKSAIFRNSAGRSEKAREAKYPRRLLSPFKMHALESWGYRLGFHKGEFLADAGVQEDFSEELLEYCLRDVRLNKKLFWYLQERGGDLGWPPPPFEAMVVESQVGRILAMQEANGVGFDEVAAQELYAKLAGRRAELEAELREIFGCWWAPAKSKGDVHPCLEVEPGDAAFQVPKRTYKVEHPHPLAGREKDCPFTPVELVEFNPGSHAHIANRLQRLYGWKPTEFTEKTGLPVVSEETLADLDYPPVPKLIEYLTVAKRLGQLSEGKKAWLKLVKDGRIHGRIQVTGTRTSRCSHSDPNTGQVPRVGSPYGVECRALFRPTRIEWVQVGADASGIELRGLGHYLAFYDGGSFAEVVQHGDPHSEWMKATGIFIRDNQKTLTYAFLYGAGDEKLGSTILKDWREAYEKGLTTEPPPKAIHQKNLGARARRGLLEKVPGLNDLVRSAKMAYRRRWLKALDGRVISMKSEHGGLNDLLQSFGAIVMKHAKVICHERLTLDMGLVHGEDFAWMLDVHDEWQIETRRELGDEVGQAMVASIEAAGRKLGVRLPLAGEHKVGRNWSETH